jgi:beta-lactamase regulating signal transducer with metallopeptidase domain
MATIKSRSAIRYHLVAALFFLLLAACGACFFIELFAAGATRDQLLSTTSEAIEISRLKLFFQAFVEFYAAHTSWILTGWAVIFCWKAVQLSGAIAYNHRLKKQRIPINDLQWNTSFSRLAAKLGIKKKIAFVESAIIKIPVVIGHVKPVIFLPVGVLNNLSVEEVEAVLLHELAHIKRNDYLVNLGQLLAEAIFFFNPAILWISSLLREERENCCDDIAITATKNKKQFIQALVSFREYASINPRYTVAFPASKNQLLKRVNRIIFDRNNNLDTSGRMLIMTSLVILGILGIAASKMHTRAALVDTVRQSVPRVQEKIQPSAVAVATQTIIDPESRIKRSVKPAKLKRPAILPVTGKRNDNVTEKRQQEILHTSMVSIPSLSINKRPLAQALASHRLPIQYEKERQQAIQDRMQASVDREQAAKDREQAMKDRAQADLDRQQAWLDRQQAEKYRKQAEIDRSRLYKERTIQMVRTPIDI